MKNLILISIAVLLIGIRFYTSRPEYRNGDNLRINGRISTEPVRYSSAQLVRVESIKVFLPLYPILYYGDTIIIEGVYEEGVLANPELISVKQNDSFLYDIRRRIIHFYKRSLPEPHASLVAGVVLGSKESIPETFYESLKASGTLHVVVASGMNVTLVAGFVMGFLVNVINRKIAVIAAIAFVWFYVILAGFEAPLVRAGIMGSIAFGAQALGKMNTAWRAYILSAFAMLFVWPQWIDDIGFILSFVATGSLMLFEPKINSLITLLTSYKKTPLLPNAIKEGLTTSTAAQIGVAPIIYLTFGQFNILSPIINALVLWTIPFITIIGMSAGIVGIIVRPVGELMLYLMYPLSFVFVEVVEFFG